MIYEQILPSKGTRGGKIKRIFQVIGFLHFLFGFVFTLFLVFIFWIFALIPFIFGLFGFLWGSIAYVFVRDYKYVFNEGIFSVYKLTAYGKYKLVLESESSEIEFTGEDKYLSLTNSEITSFVKVNGIVYAISPDDYMLSLLKNQKNVIENKDS